MEVLRTLVMAGVLIAPTLAAGGCRPGSPYDPARCATAAQGCDLDGDGHAASAGGAGGATADDCDDGDASIHPGAVETPYDGIDQDCDGGDLVDADGDGHDATLANGDDCEDGDASIHPLAYDLLIDGVDSNCSGVDDYIYLFAGTGGTSGYGGDGGPATAARLGQAHAMVFDGAGNLYFADTSNYRVRRIDPEGIVTTVVGTGESGYNGDGVLVSVAELCQPYGVALDQAGNLYIADGYGARIRKVGVNGLVTTVAGTGSSGYSGDGGPATDAMLKYPWAVRIDTGGQLFIADSDANRVRRVDTSGIIHTAAGNGTPGFGGDGGDATRAQLRDPKDLAIDAAGNLFIADAGNNRIRRVDRDGRITTFAGTGVAGNKGNGGPASAAQLNYPFGVALDAVGDLYVADSGNYWIRKIDAQDGNIYVAAGVNDVSYPYGDEGDDVPSSEAKFSFPANLAFDVYGNLYISDTLTNRIRVVRP